MVSRIKIAQRKALLKFGKARRTIKGMFSDMDEEIARFKGDFVTLLRNLDRGVTLSLAEGLSEIKEGISLAGGFRDQTKI